MFDASRQTDRRQRFAIDWRQRGLAANRRELRHPRDADENRIDGHRADRRIRRLLARRHLVERQQLQNVLSRAGEPGGERVDVADVADAPARGRWTGKQRDEQACAPSAIRRAHARPALQSKCRSTRVMPSANTDSGGSKLTIKYDSRGKSKKYPGCVRTPSVTRRTTRSSSGSRDGTRSTAHHPPSAGTTRQDG